MNPTQLDLQHLQWLAQCVMGQVDETIIMEALVAQGYSPETITGALGEMQHHPYIAAGMAMARLVKKRDWLLDTLKQVQLNGKNKPELTVLTNWPDSADFRDRFYTANRPCLLKGVAKHWPAISAWTDEYLKDRIGETDVEVQWGRSHDPVYEHHAQFYKRLMPFTQYVDTVSATDSSNDFYLTSNNALHNGQTFNALWQDVTMADLSPYLRTSPELGLQPHEAPGYLWYGPKGTVTQLHHDLTSGFLVQVRGRKRVKLISSLEQPNMYHMLNYYSPINAEAPDLRTYPLYDQVHSIDVEIEPGDVLFIPVAWWHHVRALDTSISLSFINFHWPNGQTSFYNTYGLNPIDPLAD